MPRISEFYGIIIEMYWSDHNPPHFHTKYGEHKAEIDIRTLGIFWGRLPAKSDGTCDRMGCLASE